jgi:type IV secretory pathway TrbD component
VPFAVSDLLPRDPTSRAALVILVIPVILAGFGVILFTVLLLLVRWLRRRHRTRMVADRA